MIGRNTIDVLPNAVPVMPDYAAGADHSATALVRRTDAVRRFVRRTLVYASLDDTSAPPGGGTCMTHELHLYAGQTTKERSGNGES